MVSEMVTILIFEMSDFTINGKPLDEDSQKGLFGSSFEKIGQDRRVSILHTYNLIDEKIKSSFDIIRTVRRKYLHLFSQEHDKISTDAVKVFVETVKLVVNVIGQNVVDGKIILNPRLLKYIEEKGEYIEYTPEKHEG